MLTSLSREHAPFRDLLAPGDGERPADVGIHAVEVYFPKTSVRQVDLEAHAGVAPGKFTIGLGQQNMAFCGELEDINSMMLTAVQNLLEKYGVDPLEVGRLEVGTETLIDKSKSVKSTLCQLFTEAGNNDLEVRCPVLSRFLPPLIFVAECCCCLLSHTHRPPRLPTPTGHRLGQRLLWRHGCPPQLPQLDRELCVGWALRHRRVRRHCRLRTWTRPAHGRVRCRGHARRA